MNHVLSGWQSHNIEEISEDGKKQTSTIHLPMTSSTVRLWSRRLVLLHSVTMFCIQAVLNAMCGIASEVARAGLSGLHHSVHVAIATKVALPLIGLHAR